MYYIIRQYTDVKNNLFFDRREDNRKQARIIFCIMEDAELYKIERGTQKLIDSHITVDYTGHGKA